MYTTTTIHVFKEIVDIYLNKETSLAMIGVADDMTLSALFNPSSRAVKYFLAASANFSEFRPTFSASEAASFLCRCFFFRKIKMKQIIYNGVHGKKISGKICMKKGIWVYRNEISCIRKVYMLHGCNYHFCISEIDNKQCSITLLFHTYIYMCV
jgi:hypothetical protein